MIRSDKKCLIFKSNLCSVMTFSKVYGFIIKLHEYSSLHATHQLLILSHEKLASLHIPHIERCSPIRFNKFYSNKKQYYFYKKCVHRH